MKRTLLYITMLLGLAGFAAGCSDEIDVGGPIGEGVATVSAELAFTPFEGALDGRSAGDALKPISSVSIAIFDPEGKLVSDGIRDIASPSDPGSVPGNDTESTVVRRKFTIDNIPFGRYRIYAIVNMPGFAAKYGGKIATVDDLLSIPLNWNASDVKSNGQMLGYFTSGRQDAPPADFEAPAVAIDRERMELHAYVRRAASKLTVAFDGSKLNDNVKIFIKSVQVRDIPKQVFLGENSKVTEKSGMIADGEIIYYPGAKEGHTGANHNEWSTVVQRGVPFHGLGSTKRPSSAEEAFKQFHAESVPAMYFYENMQGTGENKFQDKNGNNSSVTYPGSINPSHEYYKDKMPFGTYVEVKAYYVSQDFYNHTEGDITYRFMLGKDAVCDYNAQRNHHYKLTLNFNGRANDVDWHIEYEESKTGLVVPEKYYVSYLYNRQAMMPVTARPKDGYELSEIKTLIVENNWSAFEPGNDLEWNKAVYIKHENLGVYSNGNLAGAKKSTIYGFLSLRKTSGGPFYEPSLGGTGSETAMREHYENNNQGWRKFGKNQLPTEDTGGKEQSFLDPDNGDYTALRQGTNITLNLPLFTRAKSIVPLAVYSGNNPYDSYQRKSVVRVTAVFKKIGGSDIYTEQKDVPVFQVRRIVNPKGIWRPATGANSTASFVVYLKRLQSENSSQFVSFASEGPWRAVIDTDDDGLIQLSAGGKTVTGKGNYVSGGSGSDIVFTYKPTGEWKGNKPRSGIIRVEYHNYSCYHIILVRQGYEPLAVVSGGAEWSSYNVYNKTNLTKSPLSVGSLFRRGNLNDAIAESNNKNYGLGVAPGPLSIAGSNATKKWSDISFNESDKSGFGTFAINGVTYKAPSHADLKAIYKSPDINYAFGILYDENSSSTTESRSAAEGYKDYNNTNPATKNSGTIGVFAYNKSKGNQIFFPIGAAGYARRHNKEGNGALRYGDVNSPLSSSWNDYRPLAYDLYKQRGAIYWLDNKGNLGTAEKDGGDFAIDMNFFSFNFDALGKSNCGNNAAPLKPVVASTSKN